MNNEKLKGRDCYSNSLDELEVNSGCANKFKDISEVFKAAYPKINKPVGIVIVFGTSGEIDKTDFEELYLKKNG